VRHLDGAADAFKNARRQRSRGRSVSRAVQVFLFVYLTAAVVPVLALVGVAVSAILQILSLTVRSTANIARVGSRPEVQRTWTDPYFSIHVAARNEPPGMVIQTLKALQNQHFPNDRYEILIIDNNTSDEALWRPVEQYAASHPSIRFFHYDRLDGAKAGALNIALEKTSPSATHIVTVDADYVVEPDFLSHAEQALAGGQYDYIQFPQAYHRPGDAGSGLDCELADYFKTYARQANGAEAVLPTGTLSIINRHALDVAGGWSGDSVTEDAELGVRLCQNGFHGRYIDRVVGRGMLPLDFASLSGQRHRWAAGNMRTLCMHTWPHPRWWRAVGFRRWLLTLSQLLAWPNFALVPAAALLGATHLQIFVGIAPSPVHAILIDISAWTLIFVFVAVASNMVLSAVREKWPLGQTLTAAATRLSLAPVSARATINGLLQKRHRFVVTAKSVGRQSNPLWQSFRDHIVLFVGGIIALIGVVSSEGWHLLDPAILGCFALISLWPMALLAAGEIGSYRRALTHQTNEAR